MKQVGMYIFILLVGCSMPDTREIDKQTLIETDRQFSKLSEEQGTAAAFFHYLATDGLALPFTGHPRTKDDYAKAMHAAQSGDSPAGVLTWEPDTADVAASGDLGYTWGKYTYTFVDTTQAPSRGYYVTIWKKQADGSWRFVFDAGNQLEEK